MSLGRRAALAAAFIAVHLLLLAPAADDGSSTLRDYFWADAEAVLDGERPYADRGFEYPPLALPLTAGPAALDDDAGSYERSFAWLMIGFDLAIVLLIAFGVRSDSRTVGATLGVYTAGILLLGGIGPLPGSHLEGLPLPLARFDLAPAALLLAAVLAHQAGRAAAWSALLALGAAVKAFPALLYPLLWRDERRRGRAVVGALVPLAAAVGLVVALGDSFWSAITYHTGRELQIESLGATPLLLGHLLGAEASTEVSAGSLNVVGGGAGVARAVSTVALGLGYVAVLTVAWIRGAPVLDAATALLAVAVVLAPVLSPQFLLWILPLSALAYGFRLPNLVLLGALLLTGYVLAYYGGAPELEPRFVIAQSLRNLALVAYLALVVAPVALGRERLPRLAYGTAPAFGR